jgi:hypothetical protein
VTRILRCCGSRLASGTIPALSLCSVIYGALAVRLTAMTNGHDVDKLYAVDYSIRHAPLTDSNAPQIGCAFELRCLGRQQFARPFLDVCEDAPSDRRIKCLKHFSRRTRKDDSAFSHANYAAPRLR